MQLHVILTELYGKFIGTWRIRVALSGNMNDILVDKPLKSVAVSRWHRIDECICSDFE